MQKKTLLSLLAVPAALSAGASASIDNALWTTSSRETHPQLTQIMPQNL